MIHLNNEQQKAVRHVDGPMLVLAGPGSGKTAVLTERVKFLISSVHVKAETILVLTFSNKAAYEMRRRFNASMNSPVVFGTIHSIFFQVLKQYKNYTNDSIISQNQKMAVIRDIGNKLSVREVIDDKWCIDTLNRISAYKNTGKMPRYLSDDELRSFPMVVDEYKNRLDKDQLLDFDDMISSCLELLEENEMILNRLRTKYKYILVDEFQDCNKDQYELLKLLAGKNANIFAVEDDDQSIYGFRGADATIVLKFMEDYPNCSYVELIRNYRCGKNIIDAAYNLICHNTIRKDKTKQLPSLLREEGEVIIIKTEDAYKEAWAVGDIIKKLRNEGVNLKDISILYRTEMASDYLQEFLSKIKINSNMVSNSKLRDKENFKDMVAYFKLSQGDKDIKNYFRILNKPNRGLLRDCIAVNTQREGMLSYYSDDADKQKILNTFFNDLDFIGNLTPFAAAMYLEKKVGLQLSDEIYEYTQMYCCIKDLLESLKQNDTLRRGDDMLTLQTIHASKGLEYDTVIVVGLQEGMMPHNHAEDNESVEEERRLMYVAMTRAKKRLYLIARGKEAHGKKYSRFIYELSSDYNSIESYTPSSKNSSNASSTSSYSASSSI